jgi:molybdate transport system ATP-binding protein
MAVQMKQAEQQKPVAMPPNRTLHIEVTKTLAGTGGDPFTFSVRMEAPPGITVLFGASGAGKTTVLNCVAGLLRPETGRISVGDDVLFNSDRRIDVPVARRRIGYVFQNLALFPHLTVIKNVEYGIAGLSAADRSSKACAMLEAMRIAHLRVRRPRDISGGERQRVALARALVTDPSVLLLDEPLSGLDAPTKSRIVDDLRSWNDRHRIPILYVTHSRAEVFSLAERVIMLDKGTVLAEGSPYEVLDRPEHELAAQLAGFENIFDATVLALHEDRGTMTCAAGNVQLEVPWPAPVEAELASNRMVRIGVRAGDILLATVPPQGLSARNVISGRIISLTRRDLMAVAQVNCGVIFEVHLTPHAQDSLGLREGLEIWLVIKTHSCHLLRRADNS